MLCRVYSWQLPITATSTCRNGLSECDLHQQFKQSASPFTKIDNWIGFSATQKPSTNISFGLSLKFFFFFAGQCQKNRGPPLFFWGPSTHEQSRNQPTSGVKIGGKVGAWRANFSISFRSPLISALVSMWPKRSSKEIHRKSWKVKIRQKIGQDC